MKNSWEVAPAPFQRLRNVAERPLPGSGGGGGSVMLGVRPEPTGVLVMFDTKLYVCLIPSCMKMLQGATETIPVDGSWELWIL
jgi:hypothetical protein